MNDKARLSILAILSAVIVAIFLLANVEGDWSYVLERRSIKIVAIVLTGVAIAYSTVMFQTITNNKILTPSIIGLDSLYSLFQTFIVFLFGATSLTTMSRNVHFLLSVGLMVIFAAFLFKFLFKREGQNIYYLLLVGLIFGTFFQSVSGFMEVLIDPNDFQALQDKMFATFNNVNKDILVLAIIGVLATIGYSYRHLKFLDVLSLGKEHAINLGIEYDHVVKRLLVVIAILTSIATALVGPITFLGLLVANVAYQVLKTYQHKWLILGASLISIISLVGGQFIVEHVFTFSTTISVIINFAGGVYFLYLLLKENKSW
ncbi:MAG TPA: iron chelate uptake ABC transporter family permease subunit [Candidatus Bathyarchaeia archaeon]|nr:iron chelate uptake ABC transporter family permease subunit [Candidatus Bathyarchaeia archaeon]